ncbi:MAG: Do family serine endopeptidase [Alphaproteobacteria bacterium]|nr:Do family serine endopeptidase [Alphaproteobacteria bacterium]
MQSKSNPTLKRFILAATATVFLTGTALTTGILTQSQPANAQIMVTAPAPNSFADLVDAVRPAVVSIRVRTEITEERQRQRQRPNFDFEMPDLPPGHPLERFFRDFQDRFGNPDARPRDRRPNRAPRRNYTEAVGSGFVISADGFVVTNNHVVENADEVIVIMDNGDERVATIVGTDPRTDLALLQIEGADDLPFVEFATEEARVGDWVVAVGNPFGLGGTVTAGIISARGRDINANAYDDFLQIDAAVNRGNSGGPAFNTSGKVVGVNTAIFSPTGGNVGIAFAIPADTVKQVVFDLMDDGNVTRGFLGVSIQIVTKDIAAGVGLEEARGAMVTRATPDTPAQMAGIRSGDIILFVDGEEVASPRELSRLVASKLPGSEVELTIWRDGDEQQVMVTLGTLADEVALVEPAPEPEPATPDPEPMPTSLGIAVMTGPDGEGVIIEEVDPDSAAAEKGLVPGVVILEADYQGVNTAEELEEIIAEVRESGRSTVLLKAMRGGNVRFLGLSISE